MRFMPFSLNILPRVASPWSFVKLNTTICKLFECVHRSLIFDHFHRSDRFRCIIEWPKRFNVQSSIHYQLQIHPNHVQQHRISQISSVIVPSNIFSHYFRRTEPMRRHVTTVRPLTKTSSTQRKSRPTTETSKSISLLLLRLVKSSSLHQSVALPQRSSSATVRPPPRLAPSSPLFRTRPK